MKKISQILKDIYQLNWIDLNILECGSHTHGEETLEFEPDNNCWYIEANKEDYLLLQKFRKNTLNLALSNLDGVVKFVVSSYAGNSSCAHSPEHLEELNQYGSTFKEIEVEAITYNSLLKKLKIVFDIVVLDIEGHEKTVLNSWKLMDKTLLPSVLVIECGYDWNDRLSLLKELGYKIDCYYLNNCYLSMGNLSKNYEMIQNYNKEYPQFKWNNKLIYSNTQGANNG